jgi:hypothetical protein
MGETPKRQSRAEARESLDPVLRPVFDALCDEVKQWSYYYYGTHFISYSILKELVDSGWRKTKT